MTPDACAYCARPLTASIATFVGPVKFCAGDTCIRDWFSLPRHDRRQATRPVSVERRAS
jgi:hypothetical protein